MVQHAQALARMGIPLRHLHLLALASLLFLAMPAQACSGSPEPSSTCPTYTRHGEVAGSSVDANEHGQFKLTIDTLVEERIVQELVGSRVVYVVQDADYLDPSNPHLLAFWVYFETNGRPGLQRDDSVCSDTPEGEPSDALAC